jgi:hypothetical protein
LGFIEAQKGYLKKDRIVNQKMIRTQMNADFHSIKLVRADASSPYGLAKDSSFLATWFYE